MSIEVWHSVPDFEDFYEVSDQGRVRSVARQIIQKRGDTLYTRNMKSVILKPRVTPPYQYQIVSLFKENKGFQISIHALVLKTFVGPCPNNMESCHNDGKASNNKLSNLRYDTAINNHADKKLHGTFIHGVRHGRAKLSEQDVMHIIKNPKNLSQSILAKKFDVAQSHISRIQRGTCWSEIRTSKG